MNASLPERRFRLRGSCWSDTNPPVFKRLGGQFYSVDRAFAKRTVGTVRVAERFFSGVPHPHLLGVRRPDWFPSDIPGHLSDQPACARASLGANYGG